MRSRLVTKVELLGASTARYNSSNEVVAHDGQSDRGVEPLFAIFNRNLQFVPAERESEVAISPRIIH